MNVRKIEIDDQGRATVQCELTAYQVEPDGEWQRGEPDADTKASIRSALAVLVKAAKAPSHRKKAAEEPKS